MGTSLITGDFDGDGDLAAAAMHQGVGNTTPKRLTALTNAGGGVSASGLAGLLRAIRLERDGLGNILTSAFVPVTKVDRRSDFGKIERW